MPASVAFLLALPTLTCIRLVHQRNHATIRETHDVDTDRLQLPGHPRSSDRGSSPGEHAFSKECVGVSVSLASFQKY